MPLTRLLYVTSSSHSGSTLLAFLLNTHPGIFTISELIGANYREGMDVCSCGAPLDGCPFFTAVATAYAQAGLPFEKRAFGTSFRVADGERANRYLTATLPRLHSSGIERLRDALVWRIPRARRALERAAQANALFIDTALRYSGARVFVDASKHPHRLRHLARSNRYDLRVLYLVRDLRGVVVSNMQERRHDLRTAVRTWLWDQHDALRIAAEFGPVHVLRYEDLCADVDRELARIHRFVDLEFAPCPSNFKSAEHHIVGNAMRIDETGSIVADARWKTKLTPEQLGLVRSEAGAFLDARPRSPAAGVIRHYLDSEGWTGSSPSPQPSSRARGEGAAGTLARP